MYRLIGFYIMEYKTVIDLSVNPYEAFRILKSSLADMPNPDFVFYKDVVAHLCLIADLSSKLAQYILDENKIKKDENK